MEEDKGEKVEEEEQEEEEEKGRRRRTQGGKNDIHVHVNICNSSNDVYYSTLSAYHYCNSSSNLWCSLSS